MTVFTKRRWIACGIVLVLTALLTGYVVVGDIALRRTSIETGWILLLAVFALSLFGVCKKLSVVSFGTSRVWLQLHIYMGFLSVVVFALHTGVRNPDGPLEVTIFWTYLVVAVSGLAGIIITRWLPRRLSARGEEVIFERIPIFLRRLREHSEQLMAKSMEEGKSTVMADLYSRRLSQFFSAPRGFWTHMIGVDRMGLGLKEETLAIDKYLDDEQRAIRAELEANIAKKDDLDFHFAGQAALKYWLFVHVPLTYALLLLSILHVFIVYAFSGEL